MADQKTAEIADLLREDRAFSASPDFQARALVRDASIYADPERDPEAFWARLLITADGGYRRGQIVPLKQVADEALADAPSIENVIVVQRGGAPMPGSAGSMPAGMKAGRDHWYHRLMQDAALTCEPEPMDA